MTSTDMFTYHVRDSLPVFALQDAVDPDTVASLERQINQFLAQGHRVVAIDLLATYPLNLPTQVALCTALRRLGARELRVAIIGAGDRLDWVLSECEIPGLELHPTLATVQHVPARQPSGTPHDQPTPRAAVRSNTSDQCQPGNQVA